MDLSLNDVVKYVLEGCAVAAAAFYLPQKKTDLKEVAMIGMVAAITFFVLDLFAPSVAAGTRQGSGFGIGYGLVGGASEEVEEAKPEVEEPENQSEVVEETKQEVQGNPLFPNNSEDSESLDTPKDEATDQDNTGSQGDQPTPSSGENVTPFTSGPEGFASVEPFVSGYASI